MGSSSASFTLNGTEVDPNESHLVEHNTMRGGVDLAVELPALVFGQTFEPARLVDLDGDGYADCNQQVLEDETSDPCPEHYAGLGVDGITIEGSGYDTWVQHNFILHQHRLRDDEGLHAGDPANPVDGEDGDGIDLKLRHVDARDAHLKVQDNLVVENEGGGVLMHYGAQGVEVNGNRIIGGGHALSLLTNKSCWGAGVESGRICWSETDDDCDGFLNPHPGLDETNVWGCEQRTEWFRDLWWVNNVVSAPQGRGWNSGAVSVVHTCDPLDPEAECLCPEGLTTCPAVQCSASTNIYFLHNTIDGVVDLYKADDASGGKHGQAVHIGFRGLERFEEGVAQGPAVCDSSLLSDKLVDSDGDGFIDEGHGTTAVTFAGNLLTDSFRRDGRNTAEDLIDSFGNAWHGDSARQGTDAWDSSLENCIPDLVETCDPSYPPTPPLLDPYALTRLASTRLDAYWNGLMPQYSDLLLIEEDIDGAPREVTGTWGYACPGAHACW